MALTPPSNAGGSSASTPGSSRDAFDTPASSNGITITAAGAANTKGAWTTLLAATAAQADAIALSFVITSTGARDYLVDLGIGAAGSEVVIVPNVLVSNSTASFIGVSALLPIRLAAGVRLAARCQSSAGAATLQVSGQLFAGGWPLANAATVCTAYGVSTGSTRGTSVDPGAVINTKGAYSQLTAATTAACTAVVVAIGSQQNGVRTNANHLVDIATGGAGAETVVIPNLVLVQDSVDDVVKPQLFGPFPLAIATATRIAARQQCSINDATDRLIDVAVYAFGS